MKGRPRKQFDEQDVIARYKGGESSKALAKEVGVSQTAILGLLKRNNVLLRNAGTKLTAVPDNIEDIVRRYQAGESATEIANTIGYSHHLVEKWLKLRGIQFRGMTAYGNLDEHFFDVIDTEEKAYWLGFFCADGNVGKSIHCHYPLQMTLALTDLDHLKKFCAAMKSTAKIQIRERKKAMGVYRECQVCFQSKIMWEALTSKGILPEKSKNLVVPDIREDLQRHFWRGMIDGDGSLPISSKKYKVSVDLLGTFDVCTKFMEFVDKRFPNNSVVRPFGKIYMITIWNSAAEQLMDLLYKDSKISLDRKCLRALEKDCICTVNNRAAETFLSANHYLGTLPIGTINYALVRNRMIVGIAAIGSSSSPYPLGKLPLKFMELRRFALSQNDKNLASEFLADVIKQIRIDMPDIDGILSYADDSKGHHGIIYQAVGALYLGCSDAVGVKTVDGQTISSGRYFLDNIRKLGGGDFHLDVIKDKHKYFIIVKKGAEEKDRISALFQDKIQPYPVRAVLTDQPSSD
jgi:hypothetical protein